MRKQLTRRWLLTWLATFSLGLSLSSCQKSSGPIARVGEFTRCSVPSRHVRVEEELGGEGEQWEMHVRVVMSERAVPAFVTSCGFVHDSLRPTQASEIAGDNAPDFFKAPEGSPGRGAFLTTATSFESAIAVHPRDSDVAVFIRTRGRGQDR